MGVQWWVSKISLMPWLVEAIHWGFVVVTGHREWFGFRWDKRTSFKYILVIETILFSFQNVYKTMFLTVLYRFHYK